MELDPLRGRNSQGSIKSYVMYVKYSYIQYVAIMPLLKMAYADVWWAVQVIITESCENGIFQFFNGDAY